MSRLRAAPQLRASRGQRQATGSGVLDPSLPQYPVTAFLFVTLQVSAFPSLLSLAGVAGTTALVFHFPFPFWLWKKLAKQNPSSPVY